MICNTEVKGLWSDLPYCPISILMAYLMAWFNKLPMLVPNWQPRG